MKKIVQITFLTILLSGCFATPTIPSPTLTLPNYTATPTVVAPVPTGSRPITSTQQVTSTPTLPPLSAPTVIYNKNVGVEAKCVKTNQDLQSGSLGTGVVVLQSRKIGPNGFYQRGFYFAYMETGNLTNLIGENDNYDGVSVSPDRTLLSVRHVIFDDADRIEKTELLLMSADGKIQKALPWGKGWISADIWRDNQHLLINIAGLDPDENEGKKPEKLLWLNPFTGEQRVLIPDFLNPYDGSMGGTSLAVYNLDFTRAGYLAMPGNVYVLWDMQKKKALLEWVNISKGDPPLWSPDGSRFLMYVADPSDNPEPYPNGLYLVDNDGTVLLPALSDIYAGTKISITDYFWSPSGQFVALLANAFDRPNGEYTQKLLVLDIHTRHIKDYCVEFNPPYNGDPILIWSPDETQILLNDKYDQNHNMRIILVDLTNGAAFPIVIDMVAIGWMAAP